MLAEPSDEAHYDVRYLPERVRLGDAPVTRGTDAYVFACVALEMIVLACDGLFDRGGDGKRVLYVEVLERLEAILGGDIDVDDGDDCGNDDDGKDGEDEEEEEVEEEGEDEEDEGNKGGGGVCDAEDETESSDGDSTVGEGWQEDGGGTGLVHHPPDPPRHGCRQALRWFLNVLGSVVAERAISDSARLLERYPVPRSSPYYDLRRAFPTVTSVLDPAAQPAEAAWFRSDQVRLYWLRKPQGYVDVEDAFAGENAAGGGGGNGNGEAVSSGSGE